LTVLALLAACASRSGGDAAATEAAGRSAPDRVLVDATFNLVANGIRYADVHADSMFMFEDSAVARLYGIQLAMLDTLGTRTGRLSADGGRYDLRTQSVQAEGNVVLELSDGRRVVTEELDIQPAAHQLTSSVPTTMYLVGGTTREYETFAIDDRFEHPSSGNSPR